MHFSGCFCRFGWVEPAAQFAGAAVADGLLFFDGDGFAGLGRLRFALGAGVDGEDSKVGDLDALFLDELGGHDLKVSVNELLSAENGDLELFCELLMDFFLGGHRAVFEGD